MVEGSGSVWWKAKGVRCVVALYAVCGTVQAIRTSRRSNSGLGSLGRLGFEALTPVLLLAAGAGLEGWWVRRFGCGCDYCKTVVGAATAIDRLRCGAAGGSRAGGRDGRRCSHGVRERAGGFGALVVTSRARSGCKERVESEHGYFGPSWSRAISHTPVRSSRD
eukprot:COSAG02_NODE_81_length_39811_cov_51.728898_9_plen_164_part_00